MNYNEKYLQYVTLVEKAIDKNVQAVFEQNSKVGNAAVYSLEGGGKRIRGVLTLSVCELLGCEYTKALNYCAAIEMVHCYSLIHDDLPCMDNDDFRRGKPSCHKAFNEENALLAGDALLTAAFEVIANCEEQDAENKLLAIQELAVAAGDKGMVYGQELDLFYEKNQATEKDLYEIHQHKTGDLINAAVILGAIAANATEGEKVALSSFAYKIGLVFQIVDDMLDVTSTEEQLGKPIGSDKENGKTTFATLKGIDGCELMAKNITEQACDTLKYEFGDKSEFLINFALSLIKRNK
ncbi:MAG: polyprenyl synthetase family protein [Oscillospiraceae bacterium]